MTGIDVLDGGLLTTVQDLGRFGYQRYGVPVSGAMDTFALRVANLLVGNPEEAAGLEMTLLGARLRFGSAALIALAGADLEATVDGRPLPAWSATRVREGAVLAFGTPRDGVRAYLAVAGGVDVAPVLGSRSTYLRSKLGGFEGRALKAGDLLRILPGAPETGPVPATDPAGLRSLFSIPAYGRDHRLRVVLGPQDDRFTDDGVSTFLSGAYTVTAQSDRMGSRLAGPRIAHRAGADIVSDGTPLGAVQVAGDGVPIVLMADRGTAGGYAKIATVVSVDVGRLGQAAPGDTVRFTAVTLGEAHAALREQAALLQEIGQFLATGTARASSGARTGPAARTRREKAAAAAAAVARLLDRE